MGLGRFARTNGSAARRLATPHPRHKKLKGAAAATLTVREQAERISRCRLTFHVSRGGRRECPNIGGIGTGYDRPVVAGWGSRMRWVLRLVETGSTAGPQCRRAGDQPPQRSWRHRGSGADPVGGKAASGSRPTGSRRRPSQDHAARRPDCSSCGGSARSRITARTRSPPCSARSRSGCPASAAPAAAGRRLVSAGQRIAARRPSSTSSGRIFPPSCRTGSPPACSKHLLPVDAGMSPETLRGRTLKVGEELRDAAAVEPAAAASAITLTLDSTFIRSCEDGQRHLEVRLGNVETSDGARRFSPPSQGPTPRSRR